MIGKLGSQPDGGREVPALLFSGERRKGV